MNDRSVRDPAHDVRAAMSVVIPAHNEEAVIGRCLTTLLHGAAPGELEVIVAANGCTDRTVAVALQAAPTAKVLDLPTPSKVAALNAGDTAASTFPRAYVDADVEIDIDSIRQAAAVLRAGEVQCAAPRMRVNLQRSPWIVRQFFACYVRLPYVADDLVGNGVYMLSREGRSRFEGFPDITGDDLFIRNLFPSGARRAITDAEFHVHAPRSLRGLLATRRRTYRGNNEYQARGFETRAEQTIDLMRLLRELLRRPVSTVIYLAVNVAAKVQLRMRRTPERWERDDSSRI